MRVLLLSVAASALVSPSARRFQRGAPSSLRAADSIAAPIAEKLRDVEEPAARAMAARYESADLATSRTAFVRTAGGSGPALVLIHGFDSSCLEFRRLLPALEARGVRAFAYDIAGWGLTEPRAGVDIPAKRAQLVEFLEDVVGGDYVLVGASLGAAVAVDGIAEGGLEPKKVALLDPQLFIDGAPSVPEFAARAGVRVLRSWPLRALANRIAYYDKSLGTADAIRVGLLHCERPGWEDDQVTWLLGGGYALSDLVAPALEKRDVLVLWGDADEILPPPANVPQFLDALPAATVAYVADRKSVV